jgi:ribose transport system ATP-binding protein
MRVVVGISLVSVRNLNKNYGGVKALNSLSLEVMAGEIHAIVGENGAGKSTLMKILSGAVSPDSGSISFIGQEFQEISVLTARNLGVGIMHQELRLFPARDVLTNLFPNTERTKFGFIDKRTMSKIAEAALERIGSKAKLNQQVSTLPISEQQLIELARTLIEEPKLLILDEPTSALNKSESDRLIALCRELPKIGTTVLYVSHRLDEVFAVADHISVLRNGSLILSKPAKQLDIGQVIEGITGERTKTNFSAKSVKEVDGETAPLLKVVQLENDGQIRNISLSVFPYEIVGIAGLIGSGADELLETIFGARTIKSGEITFAGQSSQGRSPEKSVQQGLALIPADRKKVGLMMERSILDNLSMVAVAGNKQGKIIVKKSDLQSRATRLIKKLGIKVASEFDNVSSLSGGNQQKVVVAKWLEIQPKVVLLDDPTRGVDIGAKNELFSLIRGIAEEGRGVLMRSTDISELTLLCDRILIIKGGIDTHDVSKANDEELLHLING